MEIIAKKNEHFNLCATYIYEDGKVIRPEITFIPKGLFKGKSFSDFVSNDDLVDRVKFMKVETGSVEELEYMLDQEEQRLLSSFENNKGDEA